MQWTSLLATYATPPEFRDELGARFPATNKLTPEGP